MHEVKRLHLEPSVDLNKLEQAIAAKNGMPTYVMNGPAPSPNIESASASFFPPPPGVSGPIIASGTTPEITRPEIAPDVTKTMTKRIAPEPDVDSPSSIDLDTPPPADSGDLGSAPSTDYAAPAAPETDPTAHDNWSRLPSSHIVNDDSSN